MITFTSGFSFSITEEHDQLVDDIWLFLGKEPPVTSLPVRLHISNLPFRYRCEGEDLLSTQICSFSSFDISGNTTWSSCSAGLEQSWMQRSSSMTKAVKVTGLSPWPVERRRTWSSRGSITLLLIIGLFRSTWPNPRRKSVGTPEPRRATSSAPR